MENERYIRSSIFKPCSKLLNVFAPALKRNLLEGSRAFSGATVVKSKCFNPPCSQVSRPPSPSKVRAMPLGNKWPYEKYACNGVLDLVKHRVEMRTGNGKIPGVLG